MLLSIALFNWFIDPFGMYWSPQVEGVNTVKSEAGKRSRISKVYQVNKINPQILIVGNSRVEMGLNPDNKHFAGKAVYNQGIPGASVAMQVDYAIDAIANNNSIEQLLVGVDFLDFLLTEQQVTNFNTELKSKPKANYTFRLSSQDSDYDLANLFRLKEKMAMIFSLDALSASMNTIFKQNSMVNSINSHGFNYALSYIEIMNTEGITPLFKQKLQEISARLTNKVWKIKAQKSFPFSPTFSHLGRLITFAKQHDIKLTFFINPYHYSYLHTLADNNQWQNFELWKQTLVQYLNTTQVDGFTLWDFSGNNKYVNEKVPLATPKKLMQWFWEPAHYREELGNKMLSTMLTNQDKKKQTFGINLIPTTIKVQLKVNQSNLQKSEPAWQKLQQGL